MVLYLLGEIKGQCFRCCPFCYVIMLVSKLTLTTNTELYCIGKAFCLDTIITEQAESDRVSVYRQSHQHRTNSEKQP